MVRKRFSFDHIINDLHEAEVLLVHGRKVGDAMSPSSLQKRGRYPPDSRYENTSEGAGLFFGDACQPLIYTAVR